ncbi:MAG: GNAT family N-acetyltransferase [Niameybacter sp.]|uniref:GNAT family N-acetyltransferase n=1 Tax=Niameybacter sp. TaxID=2033640 RepID=UPI002FCC3B7C
MSMQLKKEIKKDKATFKAFNKLAVNVFELSFEKWYEKGYWRDKYFPYTLFDGDKAVANVSASMIHTLVGGEPKLYIQIGTVMTDAHYRGRWLSRRLIQALIEEWQDKCDGIYLYANDTVLDFYPRFGFEKATEYRYSKLINARPTGFIKLNMDQEADVKLLENYYNNGNPFSERPMLYNFGLLMFYCGTFLKDCVYYSEALACVVIASYEENVMTCYDIYCDEQKAMDSILQSIAQKETTIITFGFMPKETIGCTIEVLENEDQLFVYSNKENMFNESKMMLPLLSHA